MGASCFKGSEAAGSSGIEEGGTIGVMFRRIDKEGKGYIDMKNLEQLMHDDKTHFQGKDASHIMEKYGSDNKLQFENFKTWWNSTYTVRTRLLL